VPHDDEKSKCPLQSPVKNIEVMGGRLNPGSFAECTGQFRCTGQFSLTPKPNLVLQSGGHHRSLVATDVRH